MLRTLLALVVASAPLAAAAQYDAGEPPPARPSYRHTRFEEDWRALADPDRLPSRDVFDPAKHVALGRDVWIGFGADLRLRGELWEDYLFGAPPGADHDDAYLLTRLRAHADLHVGSRLRAFVELKSALATDIDLPGGRSAATVDTLAVQNAFAEVVAWRRGEERLAARVGRQELRFGAERLVSPSDWTNVRRSFDAAALSLELTRVRATAFFARPVIVEMHDGNEHRGGDHFYGVYATAGSLSLGPFAPSLDLYWLALDRGDRSVNGTSGDEHRHTIGARIWGSLGETGLDAELETAFQVGSLGGRTLRAGMASGEIGYRRPDWWGAPRFQIGADWASGDSRAGGSVQTFDPLFPLGHRYFGDIDVQGRSNVIALSGGVALRPLPATTAKLLVHRFWRASDADALYAASGAVLRPGGASHAHGVGTEIDVTLAYRIDPHAQVGAGYGHYFPDSFIESTGPSRDVDFVYLFVEYIL
jgi:hypothetical protein